MSRRSLNIHCRVKEYRQARGWSQEELANRMGLRRQAVYDIETGRYLPNTSVALQMAREFGCRVEDLFQDVAPPQNEPVHVFGGRRSSGERLTLGRVRGRLVGMPLAGRGALPFGFQTADGLLSANGKSAQLFCSPQQLEKRAILLGCDPAFELLGHHVTRRSSESKVRCRFASSVSALNGLAEGVAHLAGTHMHNVEQKESNVTLAGQKLAGTAGGQVIGFSLLEEGLMVAKGNPKDIRGVADLARPEIHLVNREPGAALRALLDDHLNRAGIPQLAVSGYFAEVNTHQEGVFRVLCGVADAALGFRAIAESYGLDFVCLTAARCDLVIPKDMLDHPTVQIVLDVLQSSALGRELEAIPGYDASVTGKTIATL